MPRIYAVLLVVSVAGLSADQGQQSTAPREPSFYAGEWELAVGQHSTPARRGTAGSFRAATFEARGIRSA